MDDCVLIHPDKEVLKQCLNEMRNFVNELGLEINEKTKIFPIKNGIDYLGWHFYMTKSGKIIRKVKQSTKNKYKRKLKWLQKKYSMREIGLDEINQILASYRSHLSFGHTYRLQKRVFNEFILLKRE